MRRYKDFRPTGFDARGLLANELNIGDWLVLPCSRTRDSGCLDESNFHTALKELGGECDTVQVHRFGHWGPGWFEDHVEAVAQFASRCGTQSRTEVPQVEIAALLE